MRDRGEVAGMCLAPAARSNTRTPSSAFNDPDQDQIHHRSNSDRVCCARIIRIIGRSMRDDARGRRAYCETGKLNEETTSHLVEN